MFDSYILNQTFYFENFEMKFSSQEFFNPIASSKFFLGSFDAISNVSISVSESNKLFDSLDSFLLPRVI